MSKQPLKSRFLPALLLSLIVSGPGLLAQKQDVDAVYLNNGNIYRGHLQNSETTDLIILETLCSNVLRFGPDEIDHLAKESIRTSKSNPFVPIDENGYFNRTDLGVLIGSGNNDKNAIFGVQMVNGYQYKGKIYPGIGMGIEFFEQAYIPLYADISYFISRRSVSPFVRGSLGFSVPLEDPEEIWGVDVENLGGYMYALGLGTSIRINQNNALAISLVYRFQSLRSVQTQEWNNEKITLNTQYNRIAIRVGFVFD